MSSWNSYNEYNTGWNLSDEFLMDDAWLSSKSFLLLDIFPATAAYSAGRQLKSDQQYAMQIRRGSDGKWLNIGFDSQGNTDLVAIASFCGMSDGFVAVWYDASGNGCDAIQPAAGSQPKIYDAVDGVVKENGKPAINWGISSPAEQLSYFGLVQLTHIFVISFCSFSSVFPTYNSLISARYTMEYTYEGSGRGLLGNPNTPRWLNSPSVENLKYNEINQINDPFFKALPNINNQTLIEASSVEQRIWNGISIGNDRNHTVDRGWSGKIQEIILFDNLTLDSSLISNNINQYYSIY